MKSKQSGYSLAEMLVTIAIVGMIMLVTVPNFMSLMRSAKFKGALQQLGNDVRGSRQLAITKFQKVRISFTTGGIGANTYAIYQGSTDVSGTTTWTQVGSNKKLDATVYFYSTDFKDAVGDAGKDIIFLSSGVLDPSCYVVADTPTPTVKLRTDSNLAINEYTYTFGSAGNFKTAGSKF